MEELKHWPKWLRRGAREELTREDYVDRLRDVERRLRRGPRFARSAYTHKIKKITIEESAAEFAWRVESWKRAEKKFKRMLEHQILASATE